MELIDLLNFVIIFQITSFSSDLTEMVNFPAWIPDCYPHSPAPWHLFISSGASICFTMAFPPLGNLNHVAVSFSIYFPSNSTGNALFHYIAYGYSRADCDGLCAHLKNVPCKDILQLSAYIASEFCECVQVGILLLLHLIKQNCMQKFF